jgi:aspartyl-tRNA(Asn)/glutamyl-tRNA(Gln) amidotransferase subunit A
VKALHELSTREAGRLLREGSLTSQALTADSLSRIRSLNPSLNAFILVTEERALQDAVRADEEIRAGIDRGPMHGIPYALKDILATAGIPTTCHSRLRLGYVPADDCAVEERLRAGGGVLLGKLATHEFALGGPSFDLPFPPARNPWNLDHFTGGSSSGAAAAVAGGLTRATVGSDSSGSMRGPACYCGAVAMKATYGRVSRRGVFPLSFALDHCGPITWTVEDAALLLQVIAGHDPRDPSSADVATPNFSRDLGQDLAGVRIGFPRHLAADAEAASPEVIAGLDAAAEQLGRLGADVEEIRFPDFDLFNACGRVIEIAEAHAVHEHDLRARPLDYGRYTYQRIVVGATLSAADLVQAFRLRRELSAVVNGEILSRYQALLAACALKPAPRLADFPPDWPVGAVTQHTIAFNVTGNPALAIPTGFSSGGLPIGMQLVGRFFDEPTVFRIGAAFESAAGPKRRPQLEPQDRHSANGTSTSAGVSDPCSKRWSAEVNSDSSPSAIRTTSPIRPRALDSGSRT